MKKEELIKIVSSQETDNVFEPYECCNKGILALIDFLPDNLLPSKYEIIGQEPVLIWDNGIKIQFMTRNMFRFTDKKGKQTKGHYFGFELDNFYTNQLCKGFVETLIKKQKDDAFSYTNLDNLGKF